MRFLFLLFFFCLQLHPLKSEEPLKKRLDEFIHYKIDETNSVGYIYVGDHETAISESTWLFIRQALDFYKKEKPIFIILELNTPGGEVFAAQKISAALKEMDTQFNIPIVAYIDNWAISAGALLAYSCRFIVTVKDGSMGAAEPVFAGESGKMESASEKVNSAIRADFANQAGFYNRNPLIAEAMVDKDILLVLRHGKIIQLDSDSQLQLNGNDPDTIISNKGKLLTLFGQQLVDYGVADFMVQPKKLPQISDDEKRAGEWPADKSLLFQLPFFSSIPHARVKAYQMDWKTQFFVFLATPLISSLLFMGLILGAYMEMNHPGLTFPGFIAATSLFLIVLSSFSLQLANWLELIILLTGIALILLELFILPSFGLLGFLGILLFLGGLFAMLLPNMSSVQFDFDTKSFNVAGEYFLKRLAWLSATLVLSLLVILFFSRYLLPSSTMFHRFVLQGGEQEGYIAGDSRAQMPEDGALAEAYAPLRPGGKIMINGNIYDAVSTGEFIEAGEKVVIEKVEGSTIFVSKHYT